MTGPAHPATPRGHAPPINRIVVRAHTMSPTRFAGARAMVLALLGCSQSTGSGTQSPLMAKAPLSSAIGVQHYSQCNAQGDCSLWVRIPKQYSGAALFVQQGLALQAPLAIFESSQKPVEALGQADRSGAFFSGGFRGIQLQVSRKFASGASLVVEDGHTIFTLDRVSDWLPTEP